MQPEVKVNLGRQRDRLARTGGWIPAPMLQGLDSPLVQPWVDAFVERDIGWHALLVDDQLKGYVAFDTVPPCPLGVLGLDSGYYPRIDYLAWLLGQDNCGKAQYEYEVSHSNGSLIVRRYNRLYSTVSQR